MPFKSSKQRKKCYALKSKGKNGSWNCDEWSHAQAGGDFDLLTPRQLALLQQAKGDQTKVKGIDVTPEIIKKTNQQQFEQSAVNKVVADKKELTRRRAAIKDSKNFNTFATSALKDKGRFFPNDPDSFIDEYINPFTMVGGMADALGHSKTPTEFAANTIAPLTTGALGFSPIDDAIKLAQNPAWKHIAAIPSEVIYNTKNNPHLQTLLNQRNAPQITDELFNTLKSFNKAGNIWVNEATPLNVKVNKLLSLKIPEEKIQQLTGKSSGDLLQEAQQFLERKKAPSEIAPEAEVRDTYVDNSPAAGYNIVENLNPGDLRSRVSMNGMSDLTDQQREIYLNHIRDIHDEHGIRFLEVDEAEDLRNSGLIPTITEEELLNPNREVLRQDFSSQESFREALRRRAHANDINALTPMQQEALGRHLSILANREGTQDILTDAERQFGYESGHLYRPIPHEDIINPSVELTRGQFRNTGEYADALRARGNSIGFENLTGAEASRIENTFYTTSPTTDAEREFKNRIRERYDREEQLESQRQRESSLYDSDAETHMYQQASSSNPNRVYAPLENDTFSDSRMFLNTRNPQTTVEKINNINNKINASTGTFLDRLLNKQFEKKYIPKYTGDSWDVKELQSSLSRGDKDVEKIIARRVKEFSNSPSGTVVQGASSLSDGSFPAYLLNAQRKVLEGTADPIFGGFSTLNHLGFINQSGAPTKDVAGYLNKYIENFNKATGKKLPKAYIKKEYGENKIYYPDVYLKRKQTGGKFQFGGDNGLSEEDDAFFNTLLQAAAQSQQQQEDENLNPDDYRLNREPETDEDYTDLQGQIDELKTRLESQGGYDPMFNDGHKDDDFMNFIFSDDNSNEPILFGDVENRSNFDLNANEPVGQKAEEAFNFFKNKGLPDHIAAGIVGNLVNESNLNPNAIGDNGIAKGVAQWHPDRYDSLRRKGYDLSNFKDNLEAVYDELTTSERDAFGKLLQTHTPQEAAMAFDKHFERSAGLSTGKRARTAASIYNKAGRYQAGGIANTPQAMYEGLNNQDFDHMILPLEGINTIRGLDKGKVLVMDDKGKQTVLHNNKQTTKVKGKAYEIRLK